MNPLENFIGEAVEECLSEIAQETKETCMSDLRNTVRYEKQIGQIVQNIIELVSKEKVNNHFGDTREIQTHDIIRIAEDLKKAAETRRDAWKYL